MVTKSASSNAHSASAESLKKSKSASKPFPSISIDQLSMNNVIDQIKKVDKDFDSMLSKQAFTLKLERQSGIKKTHMVYGLVALAKALLLYRLATNFVVAFALFAYPLFLSLEAVESHDKAKDAHILSYWSIIAFVQLMEASFPFLRRVIPLYNLLKITLAIYLYLPQTKGSLMVYEMALKPAIAKIKSAAKQSSRSIPLKKSSSDVDSAEN